MPASKRVADLVKNIIAQDARAHGVELSSVAVADFNIPVYDEPVIPAMVPYKAAFTKAHSIAWSTGIAQHDASILVIPEYNCGPAGGTKNAVNYLYDEWTAKPAAIVSYSIQGGKLASEAIKITLGGARLRVPSTRPMLPFHGGSGDDLDVAVTTGDIGEDSKQDWEGEASTILKLLQS